MRCHYEVLDIARDASISDIKVAYRKLALKWHPDKNLSNPEQAKQQFQIVQQAYEVLSDPQERAWYDNHREQILHGSNKEFQDNILDVFQYFTTTCFKGFGDDQDGFYSVYNKVFETISKEEINFTDDKEEFCSIPVFGCSTTDYEKVSEFYAFWLGFSTKKSYVWLDPYDIRETRDRRVLKVIEKENKKVRQKAKKERNEEIRNLVAFVRKRDKRVLAQKKIQEQKLLEDKKKREMISKQKRLERQEELNNSGSQPEWAKFENMTSQLEEIERNLAAEFGEEFSDTEEQEEREEEEFYDNLYCVACNKVFKTPKSFENHELSKKHKENVERLKEEVFDEDGFLDVDSDEMLSDCDLAEELKENGSIKEDLNDCTPSNSNSDSEDSVLKTKRKKNKKSRNVILTNKILDEDENYKEPEKSVLKVTESVDDFNIKSKKQKKKNKRNSNKAKTEETTGTSANVAVKSLENQTNLHLEKSTKNNKKGKSKREISDNFESTVDINHCCVTCNSNFPSKNRLFDHLKKTGHGVYIPQCVKSKNKNKNVNDD